MFPRLSLFGALAVLVFVFTAPAIKADTINFDDGIVGNNVGSFYAGQGVTFSNATFDGFSTAPGGSAPNGIRANGPDEIAYFPNSENPIVAMFSSAQTSVSLTGLDVGANGFRLEAYNSLNIQVGHDEVAGTGEGNDGFGNIQFFTLTINGPDIRRIVFYQPFFENRNDGIIFDNLVFTAAPTQVPEPTTMLLLGSGLVGLFGTIRRRR